jgi:hypothetical protein
MVSAVRTAVSAEMVQRLVVMVSVDRTVGRAVTATSVRSADRVVMVRRTPERRGRTAAARVRPKATTARGTTTRSCPRASRRGISTAAPARP